MRHLPSSREASAGNGGDPQDFCKGRGSSQLLQRSREFGSGGIGAGQAHKGGIHDKGELRGGTGSAVLRSCDQQDGVHTQRKRRWDGEAQAYHGHASLWSQCLREASERIVLPRLCDAVEALLGIMESCGKEEDVEIIVSDFSDAFHTMGVNEQERKHQVVAAADGSYRIYATVVFGGGGSVLIWGRGAAFLGRSGQSLFSPPELRLESFVDDPWSVWLGTDAARKCNMAVLLLWWSVLGLDIAWHKISIGRCVLWIGADVECRHKDLAVAPIPEKYCVELKEEAVRLLNLKSIPGTDLRRFAGRCYWAGGIVPCLSSMLQLCWAAMSDVDRCLKDPRISLKPAAIAIPTVRVAHALEWIIAFVSNQRGAIMKEFSVAQRRRSFAAVITLDASPWGLGGFSHFARHGVRLLCGTYLEGGHLKVWLRDWESQVSSSLGESCTVGRCEDMGTCLDKGEACGVPALRLYGYSGSLVQATFQQRGHQHDHEGVITRPGRREVHGGQSRALSWCAEHLGRSPEQALPTRCRRRHTFGTEGKHEILPEQVAFTLVATGAQAVRSGCSSRSRLFWLIVGQAIQGGLSVRTSGRFSRKVR